MVKNPLDYSKTFSTDRFPVEVPKICKSELSYNIYQYISWSFPHMLEVNFPHYGKVWFVVNV